MDRPGQVERRAVIRVEQLEIDAAGPSADIGEAARQQLGLDRLGRDHDARCRGVEPPHDGIGEDERHCDACRHVLRKACVIGGGKGQAPLQAPAARGAAQRPLGRNVDRIRPQRIQPLGQLSAGPQRQANFRIGRAGDGAELVGRDDVDAVAKPLQLEARPLQRADHAIDLRGPGIGNEDEVQGARPVSAPPSG
jgi:hypothetical protein